MSAQKEIWFQIIKENEFEYNLKSLVKKDYKSSRKVVGIIKTEKGKLKKGEERYSKIYNRDFKEKSITIGSFKINKIFQKQISSNESINYFEVEDKLKIAKTLDYKDEFEYSIQATINMLQSFSYLNTWQTKEFHDLFLRERMKHESLELEIVKLKEELLNSYRKKFKK